MNKMIGLAFGLLVLAIEAHGAAFEWGDLKRERIELHLPLLTVQGSKGILACAYIDVETCDKTGEACAIVSGVKTHDDMLKRPVVRVSKAARQLGIEPGMSGKQALSLLR
ncbi:YunC family protein [Alteromonas sp. 14N.309.X.WAT.G.H12]|uniref:YunC family protein n=1 Tax=Alteromonas sp. 14N.309.X.WAT.G.H12 TaxID=3120824 RepID=UPI002FCE8E3B